MDAENYIVTNVLNTIGINDEHKKDLRTTYDRVRRLFVNASTNRSLDNFFLTRDALNYSHAFGLSNTAAIHSAGADFQGNNLWVNIYNKIIQNAGLTDEERSFLYCLRYMLLVESMYSQIVDKMCYLLAWQTKSPGAICGDDGYCCKHVDTVDMISQRCPLAIKLEFLVKSGFTDLTDACDVELRNSVAHMTTIIGEPTIKNRRRRTKTTREVLSKVSIEGMDVRIRRRGNGRVDRWVKVDTTKALYQLNVAVWRYNIVFSLCHTVHDQATDPLFLSALNNPNDTRYSITFSKGRIRVSLNQNPNDHGH